MHTETDSLPVVYHLQHSRTRPQLTRKVSAWGEFAAALVDGHEEREDKDGPGFVLAEMTKPYRAAANVARFDAVLLDMDSHGDAQPPHPDIAAEMLAASGLAGVIYTTHSHADNAPRYRVVLPLAQPVVPGDLQRVTRAAADAIGLTCDALDPKSWVVGQFFYLPSCRPDAPRFAVCLDGAAFVPPAPAMPVAEPESAPREPLQPVRATPHRHGASVIDAFDAAHRITDTLARYGYKQMGARWLSPRSSSGIPGVAVFERDNCCFVHHSSDPLYGGDGKQPRAPFDFFCEFEHGGDIRAATRAAADLLGMGRGQVAPAARPAAVVDDVPEWVDAETGEIRVPPAAPAPDGVLTELPAAAWIDARDGTDRTRPLTEHGNALRLADAWGDRLRYLPERKAWLLWDGDRWSATDAGPVRAMAARLPDAVYREGLGFPADGVHFAKWARKSQEGRVMNSAVQMLSDMPGQRLTVAELDADPMLCGVDAARKVLDLRTGIVRAAEQGDHITKSLNVSGVGESAKATRWLGFVDDVTCGDADLLDWLHRFLGYCLTGSNAEEVFVFLFGHGANGKSVLTETIQTVMGGYAAGIQPATLCDEKRSGAGPSPDLARLDGVRFAVAPEAEEGSRFAESILKALVSGDTIPVRELNCAPFDMRPCLKLALTGNHKPTISGTDRGIWRRVRLVPFAASFEGRADMRLKSKLLDEAPHILAWLVEGCIAWQQRGLSDTPKAIAAATEAYRVESDTLGQWLEERCTKGPQAREQSSDLYTDFRQWCGANGFSKIPTSLSFLKRLGEYRASGWAIEAERCGGKRYRTGIALRERTPTWGPTVR